MPAPNANTISQRVTRLYGYGTVLNKRATYRLTMEHPMKSFEYRLSFFALLASGALLSLIGCQPDDDANCEPGESCAADAGADSLAETGGDAPETDGQGDASDPNPPSCEVGTPLMTVSGRVLDENGNVVPTARGQVCVRTAPENNLICLRPEAVDAEGRFVVQVPSNAGCVASAVMRIFSTDEPAWTPMYCEAEVSQWAVGYDLQLPETYVLWETREAIARVDRPADDERGTVTFEGGLQVDIRPSALALGTDTYDVLRARALDPSSDGLCFLPAEGPELLGLWGFGPESNVNDELFPIRIPNTANLAPSTAIDLFVLGGLGTTTTRFGGGVEEGRWERFGGGTVDETGEFIVSDQGMPAFTWFGYAASEVAPD